MGKDKSKCEDHVCSYAFDLPYTKTLEAQGPSIIDKGPTETLPPAARILLPLTAMYNNSNIRMR